MSHRSGAVTSGGQGSVSYLSQPSRSMLLQELIDKREPDAGRVLCQ